MDFLRQLYQQLANIWNSLNLQQRIFIGIGCAIVLIGLLSLSLWRTTPEHTVLFANLQPRDAAEVIEKLKSSDVSYKLSDGGNTILINEKNVASSSEK